MRRSPQTTLAHTPRRILRPLFTRRSTSARSSEPAPCRHAGCTSAVAALTSRVNRRASTSQLRLGALHQGRCCSLAQSHLSVLLVVDLLAVLLCRPLARHDRTLDQVIGGKSDANIRFEDLRTLLLALGFAERTRGSHHVFSKSGVEEQINLQREGAKAKPYQVKQVRSVILRYNLEER